MKGLKYIRNELGLSQIEFSQATGVPRYRIQLFEQGLVFPTKDEIELITQSLGISSNVLFGNSAVKNETLHD